MTVKKTSKKAARVKGQIFDLPEDVLQILSRASPTGSVVDGIVFLAHSYEAAMTEAGVNEPHFTAPIHNDDEEVSDIPPLSAIEDALRNAGEIRGGAAEVRLRAHDKSLPRDKDGLVQSDYILVSDVAVVNELLSSDKFQAHYDERFLAIRTVLSRVPEDTWSGSNIPSLVDKVYNDILTGKEG